MWAVHFYQAWGLLLMLSGLPAGTDSLYWALLIWAWVLGFCSQKSFLIAYRHSWAESSGPISDMLKLSEFHFWNAPFSPLFSPSQQRTAQAVIGITVLAGALLVGSGNASGFAFIAGTGVYLFGWSIGLLKASRAAMEEYLAVWGNGERPSGTKPDILGFYRRLYLPESENGPE